MKTRTLLIIGLILPTLLGIIQSTHPKTLQYIINDAIVINDS